MMNILHSGLNNLIKLIDNLDLSTYNIDDRADGGVNTKVEQNLYK
jgi:hypothetical protein